jgi:hypothetical protein
MLFFIMCGIFERKRILGRLFDYLVIWGKKMVLNFKFLWIPFSYLSSWKHSYQCSWWNREMFVYVSMSHQARKYFANSCFSNYCFINDCFALSTRISILSINSVVSISQHNQNPTKHVCLVQSGSHHLIEN